MLSNHPNVLGGGTSLLNSSGAPDVGGPTSSTDNALVRWNGTTGQLVKNGIVTEATDTGTITGPVYSSTTTAVGSAFTNQPANDIVEVISSNAADTTQTVTIIGTTNGSNTVVVETVTLNGTTAVPTVKTDWGLVLAVKKSVATIGTVTVRKKTGAATITAGLTPAVLSVGVTTVAAANQLAYGRTLSAVSDGATTKQLGFQGTDTSDAVIYDSKPLNGTTAVSSNSSFRTVTEIYTGDVEAARTETVTTNGSWTLTAGNISLTATGTNQSVTITPSGTGQIISGARLRFSDSTLSGTGQAEITSVSGVGLSMASTAYQLFAANGTTSRITISSSGNILIGGLTTDGTGVLQFEAGTTNAGGLNFGTEIFFFRTGTNTAQISCSSRLTLTGALTLLGGATFLTTSSALTDGAGISAGTLTTAPTAGNPTKWIGINDNGTTRYVPAW